MKLLFFWQKICLREVQCLSLPHRLKSVPLTEDKTSSTVNVTVLNTLCDWQVVLVVLKHHGNKDLNLLSGIQHSSLCITHEGGRCVAAKLMVTYRTLLCIAPQKHVSLENQNQFAALFPLHPHHWNVVHWNSVSWLLDSSTYSATRYELAVSAFLQSKPCWDVHLQISVYCFLHQVRLNTCNSSVSRFTSEANWITMNKYAAVIEEQWQLEWLRDLERKKERLPHVRSLWFYWNSYCFSLW